MGGKARATRNRKGEKMYLVVGYDLKTQCKIVYAEVTDPAKAYELAHELDAACNLGRDDEDPPTDKTEHPMRIAVEDEEGNSCWQECSEARCPVTVGLFQ